jgi:hypothetical protein
MIDIVERNRQVWIIKQHIERYGQDAEDLAEWHKLVDTRRIAYLLGITCSNKKKLQLWEEIVSKVKDIEIHTPN